MPVSVRIRPTDRPDAVERNEKVAVLNDGIENVQTKDQQGAVPVGQPPARVQVTNQIDNVHAENVDDVGGQEVDQVDVEGGAEAGVAQERQEDDAVRGQCAHHRDEIEHGDEGPGWAQKDRCCEGGIVLGEVGGLLAGVERCIIRRHVFTQNTLNRTCITLMRKTKS